MINSIGKKFKGIFFEVFMYFGVDGKSIVVVAKNV
jgi:hypothetical protein